MQTKTIKTIIHYPSFYTQRAERALFRRLLKLNKKIRLKNYPLLACIPSDIVGQWITLHGLYEEELLLGLFNIVFRDLLPQFKKQTAIDGGANIGNHTLFFSRYFKQIIAFEPNPTALKLLDTNIFLNKTKNIQVIPVGLSNQANILPFFENPENLGGSGFNFDPSFATDTQLRVEKGDSLLQNIQTTPIGLIKLDIEGHELNALQGLEETIKTHQPIILFETHTSEGKQGSKAIFNYLSQHKYNYFYTIEQKDPHPFFLVRFFEKLKGYEIVLKQMSEPEDRFYSLIIATSNPLA